MAKTTKNNNVKKRNWAFVAYPESLPEDWKEQLKLSGLQGAISPLHDKDVNPDGEHKKAHYHIIVIYGAPTTYNNVLNFTRKLNATIPQALENVRGMYRYFSHKDNPEKYQYDDKNIECFNGFNIRDFVELTSSEITELKKKVMCFIREHDLDEYSDLIDTLMQDENLADELEVAMNNTLLFDRFLTSRRYKKEKAQRQKEEL